MVQSQQPEAYTIGKLAAAAAVSVETVRFYQREGLLNVPDRQGGFRHYGHEYLRRLMFIRKAQAAGFSLNEIKTLLALDSSEDRKEVRALAQARIKKLDSRISELQQARDSLQKLASHCDAGIPGPCPILESFGL